jgi:hypothetical protein
MDLKFLMMIIGCLSVINVQSINGLHPFTGAWFLQKVLPPLRFLQRVIPPLRFLQKMFSSSKAPELCSKVAKDALIQCRDEFDFQPEINTIAEENQISQCCQFAHFRKCVSESTPDNCGSTTEIVNDVLNRTYGQLTKDCGDYNYYGFDCINFFHPWITVVAVIGIIIACCCCCMRCLGS